MIDEAQLDLLVDGELGAAERRELLLLLDAEPGGWRRCALAFLEAQAWRQAVRDVVIRPAGEASSPSRMRTARRRLPTMLAMAASFLVALALGIAIENLAAHLEPVRGDLQSPAQLARVSPSPETRDPQPTGNPAGLSSPAPLPASASPLAADPAREARSTGALEAAPEPPVPYRYVSIPAQDPVSGKTQSISMPVVPQEYLDEGWPYRLPSVLPDRLVRRLEQQGHEVVQQRRLVPLETVDGSRVVFPVDEVELVPVASRGYQ
ncbi:MAG: hypothetical protein ACYC6Y_07065 [Thermoguttaceae bacterium]